VFGTLTGVRGKYNQATALNDRGQVVGYESLAGDDFIWRGFLWQRGKMTDLGGLGGSITTADAINNRGQVAGTSWTTNGETHGFLWASGKMTDLGARFDPASLGAPQRGAMNERGQIPGRVDDRWAAVWEDGVIRILPKTTGIRASQALDINEAGTVVGSCTLRPSSGVHPCLWRNGKVLDLGLIYGNGGKAHAINDRGQVIGNSRSGNGRYHGFVWENGKLTELPMLPGGKQSQALAINNRGQIIGNSETKSGATHAVLWTLKP